MFVESFFAELAASLTVEMLRALKRAFEAPEPRKALERCAGAGIAAFAAALGLPGKEGEAHARLLLDGLFASKKEGRSLAADVAGLLRDEALEPAVVREALAETGFVFEHFPGLDLDAAVQAFAAAFLRQADGEPALAGLITITQLRKLYALAEEEVAVGKASLAELEAMNRRAEAAQSAPRLAYLRALRHQCRALPLGALGGDDTRGDVTLDKVFLELDTRTSVLLEDLPLEDKLRRSPVVADLARMRGGKEEVLSAAAAAGRAERLVLLGAPGSGKSSFVKELLALQAGVLLGLGKPVPGVPADLLPVLVELRKLAPALAEAPAAGAQGDRLATLALLFRHHVLETLGAWAVEGFAPELGRALDSGRCLLVFDGLDEVALDLRANVRLLVETVLERFTLARVVVTCRVLAYGESSRFEKFEHHEIAPLRKEQVQDFARRWYGCQLGRFSPAEAKEKGEQLAVAAVRDDLLEMAVNPMLLTTMALVHQNNRELPKHRACLYERAVEVLVQRWQKEKTGAGPVSAWERAAQEALARKLEEPARLWAILERLGYEAHSIRETSGQRQGGGELERDKLLGLLEADEYLGDAGLAAGFLDYVDQRAGLLVGDGQPEGKPKTYRFAHQTFQEYLAGRHLASQPERASVFRDHAARSEFWYLPARLGIEDLVHNRKQKGDVRLLSQDLNPEEEPGETSTDLRSLLWAGMMAEQLLELGAAGTKSHLERLKSRLAGLLGSGLAANERVEAGRMLGKLGDPRDEVTSIQGMNLCWVPPGPFLMGAAPGDEEAKALERQEFWGKEGKARPHELRAGYWLGRWPITQAQYGAFVAAGGYGERRWWAEAEAANVWRAGEVHARDDRVGRRAPQSFGEPFDLPNHPVVGVTWYEALAFCRWLTDRARQEGWIEEAWGFILPSEPEWEKAARGGLRLPQRNHRARLDDRPGDPGEELGGENPNPARIHPFLDELGPELANYSPGPGVVNTPGAYPAGASPYTCEDLVGNVWEWTRSLDGDPAYPEKPKGRRDRELLSAGTNRPRVLRGGSFAFDRRGVRCSARLGDGPLDRGWGFGFRVVLLPYFSEL